MRCLFLTGFGLPLGLIPVLALCLTSLALRADDPSPAKADEKRPEIAPPTAKELADKRMQFMKAALARYTVHVGERKESAKVLDPCLRWTNPIGGAPDGIVAVYAHKGGRPAALGQMFMNGGKKWVNEFTIFPDSAVTIRRSDRLFWEPSEYVCKFTDVPRSPRPADKPSLRLTQMRALAADFSANNYFYSTKNKHQLRLLPQPVHRYAEKGTILDGALFIFVLGTDPECCLLLEAYQDGKDSRYRYACAPMSIFQLEVRYKDHLVWSIEPRSAAGAQSKSYYAGVYSPESGEDLPK